MTQIRILGPLEAKVDGEPVTLGPPKQRLLLALLALHANEVVARDRIVDVLWPDDPPAQPANAVQVYVHGLRTRLGRQRISRRGTGYLLEVTADELDSLKFAELVASARVAHAASETARARRLLSQALAHWRGEPLADLDAENLAADRALLAEAKLAALELRIDVDLAHGEHERLVPELEGLVREHPYRERLREQLMLALYRSGRQADALAAFRDVHRTLDDELGIAPGSSLRELHRAILRQDASLAVPRGASGVVRLPRPRTRLLGRTGDVGAVCAALTGEAGRIVTVTGIGGVGKTRVAIEAALRVGESFRDGAAFVGLAAARHARDIPSAIAAALRIPPDRGTPTSDAVLAELQQRELLLVLDNLEHVMDARDFVASIVDATEGVRVLATSRARLGIVGEREYPLRPLDLPAADDDLPALAKNDAVAVFVERAAALEPSFVLEETNAPDVVEIVRAAGGLPLALELAAATIKILTPAQIRERLARTLDLPGRGGDDRPQRQRTLRAMLDWSFDLLAAEEQQLFAQLAVFRGGFTLAALEAVSGPVLDELSALLDQSLVLREHVAGREPRFRMLKLVHDYALERLAADGDDEVRERHARYYVALGKELGKELVGPRGPVATARLHDEHDNVMTALAWLAERDLDAGFELVAAVMRYWETALRARDIRPWLERVLALPEQPTGPARNLALVVYGRQLIAAGEYDAAQRSFEEARASAAGIDPAGEAWALVYLAWLSALRANPEAAGKLGAEAAALAHGVDPVAERNGLAMHADLHVRRGAHDTARRLLDQSLALAQNLEDTGILILALENWSYAAIEAGDLDAAEAKLRQAMTLTEVIDQPIRTIGVTHLLAAIANERGNHALARELLVRGLELWDRVRLLDRLEALAEMAHALAPVDPERAAVLVAATTAAYEGRAIARARFQERRARQLVEALERSPDDAVRRALVAGRAAPLATCLQLALDAPAARAADPPRPRVRPRRPRAGHASRHD